MLKRSLPLLLLLAAACTAPESLDAPENKPALAAQDPGWWGVVGPRIENDSRRIHDEAGVYTSHVGQLTARFQPDGVRLSAGGEAGPALALRSWNAGAGAREAGVRSPRLGGCAPGPQLDPAGHCLPRLEYAHGAVTEWWASTAAGYEQGFDVASAAGPELTLHIESSAPAQASAEGLRLQTDSGPAWAVSGLRAWDASGAELPAEMTPVAGGFHIVVQVAGANFPVTVDPLYAPAGLSLEGTEADAQLGYAITSGDLNGDGYPDVVVGAPYSDVANNDNGAIYSYLGSASGLSTTGTQLAPSYGANTLPGASVSADGDVTGDGYDDLVWGGPGYSTGRGAIGLGLGTSSGLSTSVVSAYSMGSTAAWGTAVRIVPDWDGDGDAEVVTGAPTFNSSTGIVYGFWGTAAGWSFQGVAGGLAAGDEFGASFMVGDFEGDGEVDLAIGAPGGAYVSVLSHVYYSDAADAYYTVTGGTGFGAALAAADLDGNGDDELVVGSVSDSAPDGDVAVFEGSSSFGSTSSPTYSIAGATDSRFGSALSAPGDLDGEEAGAGFGFALAGPGDLDGDGDTELLVGAPTSAAGGTVHLVEGGGFDAMTAGYAADTLSGDLAEGRFGIQLASAGDLDADGYDDLAVAAPPRDGAGTDAGAAYVFHGSAAGLSTTTAATVYGAAATSSPSASFGPSRESSRPASLYAYQYA